MKPYMLIIGFMGTGVFCWLGLTTRLTIIGDIMVGGMRRPVCINPIRTWTLNVDFGFEGGFCTAVGSVCSV